MSDNLGEAIKKVISEVAEVAGLLWQKGWAEGTACNISVCLRDIPRNGLPQNYQPFFISLPDSYPELAGQCFLFSATNKRMRDIARQPLRNSVLLQVTEDGSGYNIISHNGKTDLRPTGELASHLTIHSLIARRRSAHRVVVFAHATELIALTHLNELCEESRLNKLLYGMNPYIREYIPDGVGFIPYTMYDSEGTGHSVSQAVQEHDVAIREKLGVFALGTDPHETFDKIDILAKAASLYLLCRSSGTEPEGLPSCRTEDNKNQKIKL